MKKMLFLLIAIISSSAHSIEFKTGDVLLLPLRCYLCKLIESETSSPYSHSAVIYRTPQGQLMVLQSLKNVHQLPLNDFLKMKDPTRPALVLRPKQLLSSSEEIKKIFDQDFLGAEFDYQDLWNNRDQLGREKYYCSEFVAKFLNRFIAHPIVGKPMNFDKNYSLWENVYDGHIPQGEWGISPQGLAESPELEAIGLLN